MISTSDWLTFAAQFLIENGAMKSHFTRTNCKHQFTIFVDFNFISPLKTKSDASGISVRSNDEIVFQLLLVAIVDEIDPGIHVIDSDIRKHRESSAPLRRIAADQVIDFAGKGCIATNRSVGIGADELHPDRMRLRSVMCRGRDA